ncbi:MAG: GerMN domain-containing protein [Candidatus Humimicrobiia bacterium]
MGKSPRRKKQSKGFLGKFILILLIIIAIVFAWLILSSIIPFGKESITVEETMKEETSEQEQPTTQETTEEPTQETTEEPTETTEETTETTDETTEETTTEETQEKPAEITILIYFSDDQAEYMKGEYRTISNDDPVKNAVNELLKGPNSANLYALIPEGTKLLNAEIKNNIAYVDFSTDILEGVAGGSTLQRFIIYTIVNTLTEIDEVDAVQILIDGKNVKTFGDFDISTPLYRDINMIR